MKDYSKVNMSSVAVASAIKVFGTAQEARRALRYSTYETESTRSYYDDIRGHVTFVFNEANTLVNIKAKDAGVKCVAPPEVEKVTEPVDSGFIIRQHARDRAVERMGIKNGGTKYVNDILHGMLVDAHKVRESEKGVSYYNAEHDILFLAENSDKVITTCYRPAPHFKEAALQKIAYESHMNDYWQQKFDDVAVAHVRRFHTLKARQSNAIIMATYGDSSSIDEIPKINEEIEECLAEYDLEVKDIFRAASVVGYKVDTKRHVTWRDNGGA